MRDTGYCRFGDRCRYSHYLESDEKVEPSKHRTSPILNEERKKEEKSIVVKGPRPHTSELPKEENKTHL